MRQGHRVEGLICVRVTVWRINIYLHHVLSGSPCGGINIYLHHVLSGSPCGGINMRQGHRVEGLICGIAFLPNGEVLAARGPYGVEVYGQQDGQKSHYPPLDLCHGYIRDVAVDGTIVAVLADRYVTTGILHIFEVDASGHWEHREFETCVKPWSLACTRDGHFIVGCAQHSTLHKYNKHGQQIWEKTLSCSPLYISTDHKNRILVSHTEERHVTVYNENGVEIFSFPSAGDARKMTHHGLCVDPDDNILVTDGDSGSVLLFDDGGHFMRQFLEIDSGFYPSEMAVYHNRYLAVGVYKDMRYRLGMYI